MGGLVEFDGAMDALADVRRRELLLALLDRNPYDDPPVVSDGSWDGLEGKREVIAMRHTHLPKLAEYGLIDWDREHHEVRRGPAFVEIRPLLELLDAHADELPDGWV